VHALELEVVTDAQANVMAVAALVAQEAIVPNKATIPQSDSGNQKYTLFDTRAGQACSHILIHNSRTLAFRENPTLPRRRQRRWRIGGKRGHDSCEKLRAPAGDCGSATAIFKGRLFPARPQPAGDRQSKREDGDSQPSLEEGGTR
jgi:hypothetical protein